MNMSLKDKITSIVILILSILGYNTASHYTKGAGSFSKGIFIGGIVLSIALFISAQFDLYKEKESEENINLKRISMIIFITIIYFISIDYIGYFIVTPLFLFGLSIFLGYKNKVILFIYPLAFSTFLYLVFRLFLNVPLPMGILS